jgi:hypothetical protein
MIRVAQPDGQRPINLLQKHYSDELMRQSHGPERYRPARRPHILAREAVRTADKEGEDFCSAGAMLPEKLREFRTGQARAALIERDAQSPFAFRGKAFPFLAPARGPVPRAAFGNLDHARARKSELWSQFARALEIALGQLPLGACFQAPDGADDELQRGIRAGSGASAFRGLGGAILPPHLLEVVEGADFRPEDMNHEITGIDQHPIA